MNKSKKTTGFIIILLLGSIVIAGAFYLLGYRAAYSRMENSDPVSVPQTFYATISDKQDHLFTVDGMEVNDINFRGSFCFSVTDETKITWRYTDIVIENLEVGDNIAIAFTGEILETSPAQIQQVLTIQLLDDEISEETGSEEDMQIEKAVEEEIRQKGENLVDMAQEETAEPLMVEADWADYFDGIGGAAVLYDPAENGYHIYNQELAHTRRSPCSTFKIISSLIALENGIIVPDDSTRIWSGEVFWNEDWNKDINFSDAFHASCVWYFREVVDEIGKDMMQEELNRLQYGNCDISDWEGQLNTNNSNPALTGFWIESSLLISPKEQVDVMRYIFDDDADYSEETLEQLKQVMLVSGQKQSDISIYGKTGMGKEKGVVVDAWFTGFADAADKRIYFCVYFGETDNQEVSSARAREVAIEIVADYLTGL